MIEIYRASFRYFFASLPALLVFSGVMEGFLWAFQPKHETAIILAPLILVAFLFHRHFLFDEELNLRRLGANALTPALKWGWFLLASLGLIVLPIALGLAVAIGMAGARFEKDEVVGVAILIMFPAHLVMLGLFGTVLPALVARNPAYRLANGMRTFLPALGYLILGPGVTGLVIVAAASGFQIAQQTLGVGTGSVSDLATFIAFRTAGFLPTILAVAVLCNMYRRAMQGAAPV